MDKITRKVYYYDTDAGGLVYHSNYLKYFEEGRTTFFEKRGVDIPSLLNQGYFLVVRRTEIDYIAPARYGDIIEIVSHLDFISGVRVNFSYEITCNGKDIVRGKTLLVSVGENMKPRRLPREILDIFKS
ncbi:MAG: acyl-CoA thioesterase [Elusimicrobia bacterium]|nr:acyl-CoA thioesterase [Elusimicrobiota bacterium]